MDIQEAIKQYWPYALGGVVGLWLLTRSSGGSSDNGTGAFLAAQAQAGSQQAQLAYAQQNAESQLAFQRQSQTDQLNFAREKQQSETAIATATLSAQTSVAQLQAQTGMAAALGAAASGVIQALNTPAIAAMNSASAENAAVYQAAAYTAAAGFDSQAKIVQSVSGTVGSVADATKTWAGLSQGIGEMFKGPEQVTTIQATAEALKGLGSLGSSMRSF